MVKSSTVSKCPKCGGVVRNGTCSKCGMAAEEYKMPNKQMQSKMEKMKKAKK